MSSSDMVPSVSVLILGSAQSGKSTLIERIRNYADPDYVMDESLLGNRIFSKTAKTTPIFIKSSLAAYEAYQKNTGEIFDLKNLANQYEDEDDYRDFILSNPDDVTMRRVPQDPNTSFASTEFRFLDTPGLNGTQGKDSENAADIVNEIISTQSFNLIVFLISAKNPMTEEKRLALEYFAYVLRGLHSRIVFLYTHVDYAETHHSSTKHHLDISTRNKTLSTIFRRHDAESEFDENNIRDYPSLSIDLITRNRPIVQCLIQNTICEILTMATVPAVVLDTSALNIQRIRAVVYPGDYEQLNREKFESELRAVFTPPRCHAGKSTLVQHIKNYANPGYPIDISLLGNGNLSKTEVTRPFFVESNLPAYEAYRKDTGDVINLADLATRCEDEEGYREILFSREEDVGLRTKPQDDKTSSETVEFRFLDTPGLNDTNDRDSSHAVNIISEIISTRSFNLIVIIASYKNPLTQEHQLALEYYADVFKGLHTRIMFLHTHVDYADVHHTNVTHLLNMKMKNRSLSKIFRRHDNETVFDEENVKEYTSLTIDLVSKKRPVINCLIRNTIRKILKEATKPAVLLDTSSQNTNRIRAITHPSKFNDDERKKVKARFQAEAAKFEKRIEEEEDDVGGQDLEQINILLIGDVQSGKSSLVETFRLYANPDYVAKTEHITQGNSRFADEKVKITPFLADLHTVEIRKLRQSTGGYDVVDLDEEAKRLSEEDFEDLLNLGPKGAETIIIDSIGAKKYRFNIYEGPSLNESAENFEKNIFSVNKTLVESEQKFHQVLFTLAPGLITSAIRVTIRICIDIFPELRSLFSFIHTKVDYTKHHFGNKQFQNSMTERQELLQRDIQTSAAPYLIDCNLQSNRSVQRAKTYNVVHNILKTAISQTPVALMSPPMKKTPNMIAFDAELKWQARDAFQDTQKEITQNNKDLLELCGKIRQLHIDYKAKDQIVNSAKNKEDVATRDDMEVVFEDKYTAAAEPYPEIYPRTMTFKKQPRTVEKVHMVCENVEIEQALGGEGVNHWKIIYRRTSGAAASLVVKLYARKQDSAGNPVGENEDMTSIRRQRTAALETILKVEARSRTLTKLQREYNMMRFCIFRSELPKTVMEKYSVAYDAMKTPPYEAMKTPPYDKIKEIYMESESAFAPDPYQESWRTSEDKGEYSVLVFGKTQAGKSTFIEFIKNYANQQYTINESLLGSGCKSTTAEPIVHPVSSELPEYEVFDNNGTHIDINRLGDKYGDPDDYLDALNNRKAELRPKPWDPNTSQSPRRVKIDFLDTPGIEDTERKDTEHAPRIIDEMAKLRTLNLIVVIVNCEETPSKSHQLAFDYYSKVIQVLQGCHSNIVFVYTHVNYVQCHHSNASHQANMEMRHKAFSRLFRGMGHMQGQGSFIRDKIRDEKVELYPWYTVDLNKKHRPIPRCMLLNTLREILQLAVSSPPVPLDTIMGNLIRVYGISHPDELNQLQRRKIMTPVHAILEETPQGVDDRPASNAAQVGMDGTFSGADEDGYLSDHFRERVDESETDYEHYFCDETGVQKCLDDSEDENEE
ncbi:hypothetical protein CPB97_003503 [Podila verticillata]|nr:hypothetical protein CPB97_003503 [Podila verticillata]